MQPILIGTRDAVVQKIEVEYYAAVKRNVLMWKVLLEYHFVQVTFF